MQTTIRSLIFVSSNRQIRHRSSYQWGSFLFQKYLFLGLRDLPLELEVLKTFFQTEDFENVVRVAR